MRHTFQPFVEWATNLRKSEFELASLRLTLFYIVSTFFILLISSGAIFLLYVPPNQNVPVISDEKLSKIEIEYSDFSWHEGQEHLPVVMLVIDLIILFVVSGLSYIASRRTLKPIKENQKRQLDFLGTVAHELRTPLSVLRVGGETILRQDRSITEYKDFVVDGLEESKRLTRLTDQLLQLLRGIQNEPQTARCNFSNILDAEVKRMKVYANEKSVEIKSVIENDVFMQSVADNLVQIIQNLLKNAVDYNVKNGKIMVTLKAEENKIELKISDTGIGIKEADAPVIFNRFETLNHARTHGTNTGAGLGLAIVKEMVEKNNGVIKVTSEVDKGTTFTINFPQTHS